MKNLHVIFLFTLSLSLLSGCGKDENEPILVAQKIVEGKLKDPESAKFSDIFMVKGPADMNGLSTISVCGIVNGKNSFNAYAGGTRFVVHFIKSASDDTLKLTVAAIDDNNRQAISSSLSKEPTTKFEYIYWNKYCLDTKHPATYSGVR